MGIITNNASYSKFVIRNFNTNSIFPKWAQSITNFLPFSSAIYTPSMIYLGKIEGISILLALGLQLFWGIVLMLVAKSMWKALIKSLTILGG